MKVIIDRFKEDCAIVELEDKIMVSMPLSLVPKGAREGQVLRIEIDHQASENRKKKIQSLMDELWT